MNSLIFSDIIKLDHLDSFYQRSYFYNLPPQNITV